MVWCPLSNHSTRCLDRAAARCSPRADSCTSTVASGWVIVMQDCQSWNKIRALGNFGSIRILTQSRIKFVKLIQLQFSSYFVKTGNWASMTLMRNSISPAVVPNRKPIRSKAVRNREGKKGFPRINDPRMSRASAIRSWNQQERLFVENSSHSHEKKQLFLLLKFKCSLRWFTVLTRWLSKTSYTAQTPTTVIPCSLHNVAIRT